MSEPVSIQRADGRAATSSPDGFTTEGRRARGSEEPTRILVLNPKGGCGKTTVATNLACWYAHAGRQVSLVDHDAQGSSTHWLGLRPRGLPAVHAVPAHKHETPGLTRAFQFRLPFETSRVVIDTPAGAPNTEVRRLLRLADVVLVPMLPSAIDIHALTHFIDRLEREREHRPIAIVANRMRSKTLGSQRLVAHLAGLDIPVIAALHDLQAYVRCAETGRGLHDMDARGIAREQDAVRLLAEWIDRGAGDAPADAPEWRHSSLDRPEPS
jgi:chromosome partitioning protein